MSKHLGKKMGKKKVKIQPIFYSKSQYLRKFLPM